MWGESWEQAGPGDVEVVCVIQTGPADAVFTRFGSSEEQGTRFGGIEVEIEENTSKKKARVDGVGEWRRVLQDQEGMVQVCPG